MPSRPDRIRVWRGEIKRTKGGLTKADLMKNKSGKIVSRRRSAAAKGNSNLGKWLRKKGQKFTDKPRKVLTEAEKDAERDEIVKQFMAKHGNKKKPKKATYGSLKEKKKAAAPKKKKREVISLLDDDDEVPTKPYKVSVSNIRKDKRKKKEVDYGEFDPSDFDY